MERPLFRPCQAPNRPVNVPFCTDSRPSFRGSRTHAAATSTNSQWQVLVLQSIKQDSKRGAGMKRFVWTITVAISILVLSALMAQSNPPKVVAEFAGASLKWIHAAEPEFQRKKLDFDKYIVSVVEQDDSVIVLLRSSDSVEGSFGSTGKYPGYEVEISKKELKVARSNYVR
jgi:hypothetical protein